MMKLFSLVSITAVAMLLAGCVGITRPDESTFIPYHDTEVQLIQKELGCAWTITPDKMQPLKGNRFGCVVDEWGTVTVYYTPLWTESTEYRTPVGEIEVFWKQWDPKVHTIGNEHDIRLPMIKTMAYLARRFLPEDRAKNLVNLTVFDRGGNFSTRLYRVRYETEKADMMQLGQLTMTLRQKAPYQGMPLFGDTQ